MSEVPFRRVGGGYQHAPFPGSVSPPSFSDQWRQDREEAACLEIAKVIDPVAFSEKYAPVLRARWPQWLAGRERRITAAIAKARQCLAIAKEASK